MSDPLNSGPADLTKPPLVLIHGMWGRPSVWDRLHPLFRAAGYQVITPQLRFHGGTEADLAGLAQTGLNHYLADLADLLVDLPDLPVLIGHSMGGLLAQMLAARGLARGLALLAPAPPAGITLTDPRVYAALFRSAGAWGFWNRAFKPSLKDARALLFNELPPHEADREMARMVPDSGRVAFETAFWYLDTSGTTQVPAEMVTCPVAMIAGGQDRLFSPLIARAIARRYPTCRYWERPARGHWLVSEPGYDEIAAFLLRWLNEVVIPAPLPKRPSF